MTNLYKLFIAVCMVIFLASGCKGPGADTGQETNTIRKRIDRSEDNRPYSPETTFAFDLSDSATVIMVVYKIDSTLVDTIANSSLAAGNYEIVLKSRGMESGIYFYKLIKISIPSGDTSETIDKIVLLK